MIPIQKWWIVTLKGLLLAGLGVWIMMTPIESLLGIVLFLGIAIFISGIFYLVGAIASRKTNNQWGWYLVEGIVDIVFGLILMTNPAVTMVVLPFLVGFWAIFGGILQIGGSFSLKSLGMKTWWLVLLGGVVTAVLGWIIVMHPVISSLVITVWIGVMLLLFGLLYIIVSFGLKRLHKEFGNE